jgi:hypothetical protein
VCVSGWVGGHEGYGVGIALAYSWRGCIWCVQVRVGNTENEEREVVYQCEAPWRLVSWVPTFVTGGGDHSSSVDMVPHLNPVSAEVTGRWW